MEFIFYIGLDKFLGQHCSSRSYVPLNRFTNSISFGILLDLYLLRYVKYFIHDFHFLPFVKSSQCASCHHASSCLVLRSRLPAQFL